MNKLLSVKIEIIVQVLLKLIYSNILMFKWSINEMVNFLEIGIVSKVSTSILMKLMTLKEQT